MNLIEKIEIEDTKIMFYEGIDFDLAIGHSDDSEFLIFFVESYVAAAKAWLRTKRLDSILEGKEIDFEEIPDIGNHRVAIYQTSGNTEAVYETVRKKLLSEPQPWSPPWGIA